MISHTLTVELGDRSYPIYIGEDLLGQTDLISNHIHGSSAVIVSNTTVAPLYLDKITNALDQANIRHDLVILDDGEKFKTIDSVLTIVETLLNHRHDRKSTVIALGGGVVGDIAGFAASIYQRGIHFIQIPTTLLSQVDSSVGGKTGVNHPLGKNMIGAFYQPQCVIVDTSTLTTLTTRELSAGLAEVIKYGLIYDATFFDWIEQHAEALMKGKNEFLALAILTSCRIKAEIVAQDERESGIRAILNLGHTFGHAIETKMGYGNWLHGEAVAAGMVMAADLSLRHGWIKQEVKKRTVALLGKCSLPVMAPRNMSTGDYMDIMSIDKKAVNGTIKFVLLKALGEAIVTSNYNPELLKLTLIKC
ncbi:MAG: 3-dehydroquinate synthase [Gammaproteobacteria bacterium]|nr:3-dehydroquinate synthase [Gammaproteobacteria bacterium]